MTVLEKSIKQLNRVSISFSLGLGLVLGVVLGLVLGLVPSSDVVLKSTVLSSSCVPTLTSHCRTILGNCVRLISLHKRLIVLLKRPAQHEIKLK